MYMIHIVENILAIIKVWRRDEEYQLEIIDNPIKSKGLPKAPEPLHLCLAEVR